MGLEDSLKDICPGLNATKSPNDPNTYRLLRLSNGIEVLLAASSDDRKQKAACAVSVQVGSFSDPRGKCEGLAHYCEHMLFLGSQKYPGEAMFEEFLSENGGYSNAFTECEHTCYYFEVNRKALHPALDMFAHLLHDPLFTEDSSARELEAIESEFQQKKHSDGTRTETLFSTMARSDHPWTLFGWGNLQSLRDEPASKGITLHSQLRAFYEEHYKPSRMRLCVFGVETLDALQEAVGQSFSPIPACPGVGDLDFAVCGLPFAPGQLPRLLRVRPIKDTHSLTLSWQLPPSLAHYISKPGGYISHLLGDEGRGSVLSFLKDEGLATELSAGSGGDGFSNSSNSEVFSVEVALTELGMQQWPAVASAVFQYLKVLRDYGEGLPAWPHEEQKLVAQMSFRFQQEKDPCDLVQQLSERMLPLKQHRPEHLLVGPWLHEGLEVALIRSILNQLTVRQCFVILLSSSFGRTSAVCQQSDDDKDDSASEEEDGNEDEEADGGEDAEAAAKRQRVESPDELPAARRLDPLFDAAAAAGDMKAEPRFGTEYWDCELDEGLLREWEDAVPNDRLHVPRPSEFIATDFTILPRDSDENGGAPMFQRTPATEGFPVPSERLVPEPQRLWPGVDRAPLEAWHLNCAAQFNQPRSEVWLKITSPHYAFDPKSARKEVLMQLYARCLRDSLNETTYPASQARLHCSVNSASHGLTVYAGGFSQKVLKLVESALADLPLEDYYERGLRRLGAQKEALVRDYKNSWLKPNAHCSALRRLLLMPCCFRPEQLERELASSTLQELREFTTGFLAKTGCTVMAAGNTSREELQSWAEACVSQRLRPEAQPLVEMDVVQLERGKTVVCLETALDATQKNSALEVYWQIPGRDGLRWEEGRSKLRMFLELLEEVMSEPLFDSLRTKQQLGYSVSCMQRDTDGVLGFTVTILSAVKRPPGLLERIEDFLEEFSKTLQDLPAEKFAAHIVALGSRWLEPKRTLSEVQSACWSEVACGFPVFDRTERDTAVLGTVTREELAAFFSQHIAASTGHGAGRIVASVSPAGAPADEGAELVTAAARRGEAELVRREGELHARAQLHPPRGRETAA